MNTQLKNYLFPIGIFLASLIFLGWGIWDYPLIDLDEPRYPEAAREMIENSQYWIPMTNGKLLFEKPILIYWSMILAFKSFGVNEFAARLPSVIAGALTITSTYLFTRFFKIGIVSCLILVTSLEYFIIARLSIPEMLLNFFTITAIYIYFLISQNLIHKNYFYLMSFLMALGFMAKGPLAIFVPGLVIFCYALAEHLLKSQSLQEKVKIIFSNLKILALGTFLFLIIGGSWFVVAHFMTDGGFTNQFFLTENLQRYTSTLTGHKFNWWFYLLVALVGFLPWTFFMPAYLLRLKTNLTADPKTFQLKVFLLIWIFANIIFFTSSGTKLYNYVFSIFSPMAILAALWFVEAKAKDLFISSVLLLISGFTILAIKLAGFFDEIIAKEDFLKNYIAAELIYIFVSIMIALGIIDLVLIKQKMLKTYFFVSAIAFALIMLLAVKFVIMPFADYKVGGIKKFASLVSAETQVYRLKIDRPSLSFYLKGYTKTIGMKKLRRKLGKGESLCLLAKKDRLKVLENIKSLNILFKNDLYIYVCSINVK